MFKFSILPLRSLTSALNKLLSTAFGILEVMVVNKCLYLFLKISENTL